MTSRSGDGEILSRYVQGFGIRVVRGSSSRGGARAFLTLARVIREKGDNVLIHAAAGGVGLIACQWANHLGANVIGTVGSKDKGELAKKNGAHHIILYRDEDFVAKVKDITNGEK